MRAVKCHVSDATANAAHSQGQLEEELLIYGQCYCNSSTTCRQASAFHLQTTGSIEELFPISYHWALSPFHLLPLSASVILSVCLSVLLCLHVGFTASVCLTHTLLSSVSIFSLSHTHTLTQANTVRHLNKSLFSHIPP